MNKYGGSMMMHLYREDMVTVMNALESIVIDEYLVTSLVPNTAVNQVYRNFLEKLKYEYRWFGVRSENEFVEKWNDLRKESFVDDSDFVDTNPSVQTTILSNITQRMALTLSENIWGEDGFLCSHIARTICVYNDTPEEPGKKKLYDEQISSTLTEEAIRKILSTNKWLIVVILINWISNQTVLQALGHLTYDSE